MACMTPIRCDHLSRPPWPLKGAVLVPKLRERARPPLLTKRSTLLPLPSLLFFRRAWPRPSSGAVSLLPSGHFSSFCAPIAVSPTLLPHRATNAHASPLHRLLTLGHLKYHLRLKWFLLSCFKSPFRKRAHA